MSEPLAEESTAPKAAVMMVDRPGESEEVRMHTTAKLQEANNTKNVVIFSDSMAKYTQQYLSGHEFSYQVVAHRGAQIHDVTRNVREFSASDFDDSTIAAVVLHVGTNNLCNTQTLDQNIRDYEELLQSAASRFPNAGILVSGILPRFDSEDLNDAVQQYNIIFAQLCTKFADKVKFVDLGSHFRSDCFFAIDGLHLSYQGNPRFATKLQEAIEYHFSTDQEHVRWKEVFTAALQKVPFPKPSLLGPMSSASPTKVKQMSQKEVKPNVPRRCLKSVSVKRKVLTRSRRKCWYPKHEKKCSDVSNWTGWTRCQGPTAACSPSGNGPKWKTEYLIRTNCCLYKTHQKAQAFQPKGNTRKGKKRKRHEHIKIDQNPRDVDKLEELLAVFAEQSSSCQEASPMPRKYKKQFPGVHPVDRKAKDCYMQQKECTVSSPSTDCHVNPHPTNTASWRQNTADSHDVQGGIHSVYIRMWDGQLLKANVADDSTTKELNDAVANAYGKGLPEKAAFYSRGLKVKEEMPLKQQGIVAESTVQVLLKLKGGGDKGDGGASGDAEADKHMTEWTVEEAVQWLQTEGKMKPEEVKPLVEEQVDGLALWEMTVDSLKKHFSCLSGGAKIKLSKALKAYKESWPNFEHAALPDELPANVTCWREKEIRLWLSCVVKCTQDDIESVCALDLDGDSLLKLDEETVKDFELLPMMKKGPSIKLFSCLNKLNQILAKRNPGAEEVMGGKDEEPDISLSTVETRLNEAASDISHAAGTADLGDSNKAKATDAFVSVSDTKIKSQAAPDTQVTHQKPAQVQLAQPPAKPVKVTEKETIILNLLKSSDLNLYESQLTPNFQQCEISVIYARPKKKNELDQLFNFLVVRKVQDSKPPNQSQVSEFTKHLWSKIRKDLCHWVDFLPKKCRKDFHADPKATSSENVFQSKDKTVISLSKKDPTCVPLGQVDIAVLKSFKTATTIFIVEESFTSDKPQEYITQCGAKDKKYYFQYCKNANWHAHFDERNLMKGFVMKANVVTEKSNSVSMEKESEMESPSIPPVPQSPKESISVDQSLTESKEAVGDVCITDSNLHGSSKIGQQDLATILHTNTPDDQNVKKTSTCIVGANQLSIMGEEQASCVDTSKRSDMGTLQTSPSSAQPQLPAPLTISGHPPTLPPTSNTYASLSPGKQKPFPFGRSDIGNLYYKRGAVLTVMESGSGSLLSPSHEFKVYQQIKPTDRKITDDARDYFIFETLRFATGCINARSNGTIHFGVGDDVGGKYQHGEIVGVGLQEKLKAKFDDILKDSIPICFRADFISWAISAVNQCINPVRFVPVYDEHSEYSVRKYVIEVDVTPTFAITESNAFFIKFPRRIKQNPILSSKIREGECLYFRKRASTVCLYGPKLNDFQHNLLPKLVQERKMQEQNATPDRPSYNRALYAKKLEGCLLGGEPDLRTRYPILFMSKADFQGKQRQDIERELSFITEIPWIAIFDLDPNSDGSGICHLFRSQMDKECSLYQPEEKFFHFSDHEELADAILFPEKTCWIFANGRNELDEKPYPAAQWNGTERCKAVKNAISFFSRPDKIPQGKAVIVFLILSEEIEIMVSCFRYCFDDFCGIDNFLCLFENENTYELWANQVQGVCSLADLKDKSIVGMPGEHINQTVQFINGFQAQTEPLIPTSSGSYVTLTKQFRNKLDDLEILSKNQCEDLGLDPESDYFKELCQKKEMMFYKGNEVDWLNFFFTDVHYKNHVMTRDKFSELHKLVSAALYHREPQAKRKSVIMTTLYYQAGSGATTLGRHILWAFRKNNVRCCVVQRITDYTANQILDLRGYGEETENECFPVLMLIDNKNEEHVQILKADIERLITNKGIISEIPVCIILQCKHTQDAKKQHDRNRTDSEYLEQKISKNEMKWLENKQKDLEKTISQEDMDGSFSIHESDSDTDNDDAYILTAAEKEASNTPAPLNLDKDPSLFIKFMILRKNFDPEFVKNVVANSLKDIKGNELLLLCYTALLNVFAKGDSFLPLHCAEALMGIDKNRHLTMNSILSPAVRVFLILVERLTCGNVQGYKVVDPVLANEVLVHIVKIQETNRRTYSSIACEFLGSRLFSDAYTTKDLIFFTKEMLKRRKKLAYGDDTDTQFSLLVEHICREETYQDAVTVLKKGFKKFVDPMIAQTLARLFTKHNDFAQAHIHAQIAVDLESDNSYLLVTAGKVYHEEMIDTFRRLDKRTLTLSMLKNTLSKARSAVEQYSKSQEANQRGSHAPNLHCYLEDIKVHFKLLSMIKKVNPFIGNIGQAMLQRYLVDPDFVPDEAQEVWKDYHKWVKSIKPKLDVCIDIIEKDLTYSKQKTRGAEHEQFKEAFYQQVRNYPKYFGMLENTFIASDEERNRLQACTLLEGHKVNFSIVFDYIRKGKNAAPNLQRVMELLKGIAEQNAFDLEGLISVSLALSTVDPHSKKIPSFKQVFEWSVLLSTLAPSTLEPHFFLTMFLWPREDMDIDFDAGLFRVSKERLPTLYKEHCPKTVFKHVQAYKRFATTSNTRPMPATNFFLSKERGLQSFLHISCFAESQRNFDRDQFWENDKVQKTLRRLEGICLDKSNISYKVKDLPSIEIRSSRPIMIKGASQDKVSFFLGFTWKGPIAYHVKVHED